MADPVPVDFDVFNGDADGICALHQLRLAEPRDSILVTGAKREIALLARVSACLESEGATTPPPIGRVTVLDIAIERNLPALQQLLAAGATVQWIDHHEPGPIPDSAQLDSHIDTDPAVCTSILVDRLLGGRYRRWAICAAYGDGMPASAVALAGQLPAGQALSRLDLESLRIIGEALNYNAYAADTGTAVLEASALYRSLDGMSDPLALIHTPLIARLTALSASDLAESLRAGPILDLPAGCAWLLPPTIAARRARGLVAQRLRARAGQRTVLIIAPDGQGRVDISIRCPAGSPRPASSFARRYDGGGGRATAAGIDRLPADRLSALLADFERWLNS